MEINMAIKRSAAVLTLLAGVLAISWSAPDERPDAEFFPRCAAPEEEGVDSAVLVEMCREIEKQRIDLHGLIVIRNGRCVFECYRAPYGPDVAQNVKSICKSMLSALTGIALRDKVIDSLDSTVASHLSGYFPEEIDPRKKAITLRHLLTMMSGLKVDEQGPAMTRITQSDDWVRATLESALVAEPGSTFQYSSALTQIMSVILSESSGKSLLEYMSDALLEPLGIDTENIHWTADPRGYHCGGGELWLTPRDLARFGALYLDGGKRGDNQVVPANWVAESTRNHLPQGVATGYGTAAEYGYWWWLAQDGSYAATGFGGQAIVIIPDRSMIVVITGADHQLPAKILPHVVTAASSESLPPNSEANRALDAAVKRLATSAVQPVPDLPAICAKISGKKWSLDAPNAMAYKSISLTFGDGAEFQLKVESDMGTYTFDVGLDDVFRISPSGGLGSKPRDNSYAVKGKWRDANALTLHAHELGSPVHITLDLRFQDDKLHQIIGMARPTGRMFHLDVVGSGE